MSVDVDKSRALAHYTALLEELNNPTTRRITIEVFGLEPGTDLMQCSLEFGAPTHVDGWTRRVMQGSGRRARLVGLWRIVPEVAPGA